MKLLAIDPGDERSAMIRFDTGSRLVDGAWLNANLVIRLSLPDMAADCLLIEYTPPYTLQTRSGHNFVPNQILRTSFESGRFCESWGHSWELVSRLDVKKHLLGRATGTDADVTQAILDRYGGTRQKAVGKKAEPGPLYGLKKDLWAALAVAITWSETKCPIEQA